METRLYIAVTSREMASPGDFLSGLAGLPVGIKVGLEIFVGHGPGLLKKIVSAGFPLFLDLKFHDIPFTVAGAVRAACRYSPSIINVHASGGVEMMREAAGAVDGGTRVLAVTVLTSLGTEDLAEVGLAGNPGDMVPRMAKAAMDAGLDGVVCSPMEAAAVRRVTDPGFCVVTPGIRPLGSGMDDQRRVSTPGRAIEAGATALVVGRPVTMAENPRLAVMSILDEIDEALKTRRSSAR